MIIQKYEIKIALLGYVSVGKTTTLNALFRDKFSEVSMGRTTAGINFFRIVSPDRPEGSSQDSCDANGTQSEARSGHWSVAADEETQKAEDVLHDIEASNLELREDRRIEEKWFSIELETPLCDMRSDTSLVIVDIPGINEADTDSIYMKYVEDNWKSFDCVVVVMDARQGVNTEEQVDLLKLIKNNLDSKKQLPTIFLFNKVDEPDDSEQELLVSEARQKLSEVFGVGCREMAMQQVLHGWEIPSDMYPVFIPTSAVHAFFYRTASLLSYEKFRAKFDVDLIDKIGREEVGRFQWKKLKEDEKYQVVFKAVQDDSNYKERLAATNFDKFLRVLSLTVGGHDAQLALLKTQLDVAIQDLQQGLACSTTHLRSIHDRSTLLGKDMEPLKSAFWSTYERCKNKAMTSFENELDLECLGEASDILWDYLSFVRSVGWTGEEKIIRRESCDLVRQQIGVIVNKQDYGKSQKNYVMDSYSEFVLCENCKRQRANRTNDLGWDLSLYDWLGIFESVLLMSYSKVFCDSFSQEKFILAQLKNQYISGLSPSIPCMCIACRPTLQCKHHRTPPSYCYNKPTCGAALAPSTACLKISYDRKNDWNVKYENGSFDIVGNPNLKNIEMPTSVTDRKHWGYVTWKGCKLLEVIENGKSAVADNSSIE